MKNIFLIKNYWKTCRQYIISVILTLINISEFPLLVFWTLYMKPRDKWTKITPTKHITVTIQTDDDESHQLNKVYKLSISFGYAPLAAIFKFSIYYIHCNVSKKNKTIAVIISFSLHSNPMTQLPRKNYY